MINNFPNVTTISMKTFQTIIILSILLALSSCKEALEEGEETVRISSTFDSPFPKNNKKLSNILGDELMIKIGGDTLNLKITSTKTDNLIIDSETNDTLFFGSVCKYRDFYYFNEKLNDTSYYISAVKIKGNLIYGLRHRFFQFIAVDDLILSGKNKKLVKYFSKDSTVIRLHVDKKEMRNLFTTIMSTIQPDTILQYNTSHIEVADKKEAVTDSENDQNDTAFKVYPNPATDFITIELQHKSKSSFQIADLNGRTILRGQLNESVNKIDIANQPAGIYIVTVSNAENNKTEATKIVIK